MPETIALPDTVYQDLVSISEELSDMARKPISLSMAVYLLTAVYRAHLHDPCAMDMFRQKMANADIMSPEEFEKAWDLTIPNKEKKNEKK
ncbi:MAG: hypothetical protein NWF00_12460 [Candidatus Bathyarchaeota archaeon]|nr:hypothetical protein [Candidatus Bathyarchaeota archaeon]